MNLYRSFGNLMEAWMTERSQCSHPEWMGNNDEDSSTNSSQMGTNLRSESVDSGVETASSDMSFLATPCSASTDNTEGDTFPLEREASASQSPVFSSPLPSSSSPRFYTSRAKGGSAALHHKVEQALQRTHSKHLKDPSEALTAEDDGLWHRSPASSGSFTGDVVLRRPPRSTSLPKRHSVEVVRGQRPESFASRSMVHLSASMRHTRRRPMSMTYDRRPAQTRLEDLGEEEAKGMSPGLCYLEHVCQMLEEIARQQIQNQAFRMEADSSPEHQDVEAPESSRSDSQAADEELSSYPRLEDEDAAEQSSSEPQRRKDYRGHFRQRSASDTNITTLHLRKLNAQNRRQQLSTEDLWEISEEDHIQQEETDRIGTNWKFRIGALMRGESLRDVKGQPKQSSEKNWARRRLSQLFRRSRKKNVTV